MSGRISGVRRDWCEFYGQESLLETANHDRDNAVPDLPICPVTRPGDVWLLGPHKLLCGDATSGEDIAALMAGEAAAMAFTDPPYNVRYIDQSWRRRCVANDDLGEQYEAFISSACANILAATNGAIYVCISTSELPTLHHAFTRAGGHISTVIIWAKDRFMFGRSDYHQQYEPILYGWRKGGTRRWYGPRTEGNVWYIRRSMICDLHPTMKPVALIERAVRNSSASGDIVLDPFAGSGSTLIACHKTGRLARLVEIEPQYCDIIIERYHQYTGTEAILHGDGRTFHQLRAARTGPGNRTL